MSATIILMLKAPEAGNVKTRLGREIGMVEAARAYRCLVEHQLRQIPEHFPVRFCYAPAGSLAAMQQWLGGARDFVPQAEGDLGVRLRAAMERHFAESTSPLLFIGGDCPYLSEKVFRQAEATLLRKDAVVVPAEDGGYCLLGLRQPHRRVFEGITWSTGAVLEETRQALREAGLTWEELPALEDVDDGASWKRARRCFPELDPS